jgi:hypothetical protein
MMGERGPNYGGPADADFVALAGREIVEQQPGGLAVGMGGGGEAGGQTGAQRRAAGGEGVEVQVAEGWVGEGDRDGVGSEEDVLFDVGEGWGRD